MGQTAITLALIHFLGFLVLALTTRYFRPLNLRVRMLFNQRRRMQIMPLMLLTHRYSDLLSMSIQVIVLAGLFGFIWQDWSRALILTAAMFSQTVLVSISKKLSAKARPPQNEGPINLSSLSYPSGHSAASMTFALLVPLLLSPYLPPVLIYAISGYLFAVALLTAYGRLYLDLHWLTDILGAWLLAGAIMHLCRLFLV